MQSSLCAAGPHTNPLAPRSPCPVQSARLCTPLLAASLWCGRPCHRPRRRRPQRRRRLRGRWPGPRPGRRGRGCCDATGKAPQLGPPFHAAGDPQAEPLVHPLQYRHAPASHGHMLLPRQHASGLLRWRHCILPDFRHVAWFSLSVRADAEKPPAGGSLPPPAADAVCADRVSPGRSAPSLPCSWIRPSAPVVQAQVSVAPASWQQGNAGQGWWCAWRRQARQGSWRLGCVRLRSMLAHSHAPLAAHHALPAGSPGLDCTATPRPLTHSVTPDGAAIGHTRCARRALWALQPARPCQHSPPSPLSAAAPALAPIVGFLTVHHCSSPACILVVQCPCHQTHLWLFNLVSRS